jgi:hypothetical protein
MAAINKIAHNSPSHANPSELELQIAQALFDLESSVSDLKAALRPLQFSSAKEVIILRSPCSSGEAMRHTQSPLLWRLAPR